MKSYQRHTIFAGVMMVLALLAAACGGGGTDTQADSSQVSEAGGTEAAGVPIEEQSVPEGRTELLLWTHSAGNPDEFELIQQIIQDFNDSQDNYAVVHEAFPQGAYNDSVVAGALAGGLPDILDVDAPITANWAWAGYLAPLELSEETLNDLVDGAKGVFQDEVYSVGLWDVATGLFGRRSVLEDNGIRVATNEDPWSCDEFDEALRTLQASGDFEYAIDIGAAWDGEWVPYAWGPLLQSFGGDLINRDNFTEAEGILNGPEAVAWGEWFQGMFEEGLVAPGEGDPDRDGFINERIAMQYDGVWRGTDAVEAFGDDAVFMPPPDCGDGPVSGVGSWQWGISATSENPEGAQEFVEFAVKPEYVAAFSERIGLIPSMQSALSEVPNYSEDGPFNTFFTWTSDFGLIRPPTPAYLTISAEFEKAALDIADGADPQTALDAAVDAIEQDIEQNNNYGF